MGTHADMTIQNVFDKKFACMELAKKDLNTLENYTIIDFDVFVRMPI